MRRIGLIVNLGKERAEETVRRVAAMAADVGLVLVAEPAVAALAPGVTAAALDNFPGRVDAVAAFGGDGTMLKAAHQLAGSGLALAGFNIGSLGYLTSVEESQFLAALTALRDDRFVVENRTALTTRILRADGSVRRTMMDAMNDVVVARGASGRALSLAMCLDGRGATTYVCDGIILATPTGSTAYSLSVGGPIVMPGTPALVMSVISPHTLSSRPVVLPDRAVVTLGHAGERDVPWMAFSDGQEDVALAFDETVEIRRSSRDVPVILFDGHDPFAVLCRKLGWGGR